MLITAHQAHGLALSLAELKGCSIAVAERELNALGPSFKTVDMYEVRYEVMGRNECSYEIGYVVDES